MMQTGDEVKVLLGGRMPFVLRPTVERERNFPDRHSGNVYTLIGDCFLQGIMDGERVVEAVNSGEYAQPSLRV